MKNFYIFFFLFSLSLFAGCTPEIAEPVDTLDLKQILTLQEEEVMLSSIAKDFEYIRPEAKPGSFFTLMGIRYIGSEFILLWEKRTGELFAFKRSGEFISQVGKKGGGPEEYENLSGVYVFEEINEVHIYDRRRKRILRFDMDFRFIDAYTCDPVPNTMTVYQGKYYLCASENADIVKNNGKDLIIRDPRNYEEVKTLLKRSDIKESNVTVVDPFEKSRFMRFGDSLLFFSASPSGDYIYKIFNDKVTKEYELLYGDTKFRESRGMNGPEEAIILQIRDIGAFTGLNNPL